MISSPGARHSVALMDCVISKKNATEWRAPGHDPSAPCEGTSPTQA
jgi:hypothetical protein